VIRGYITFREGEATRKERRPVARWWAIFLGDVERRALGSAPKLRTAAEMGHWVWLQAGPTLRMLQLWRPESIPDLLADQDRRLSPRHKAILAAAAAVA
jgi:hypothetical protein